MTVAENTVRCFRSPQRLRQSTFFDPHERLVALHGRHTRTLSDSSNVSRFNTPRVDISIIVEWQK